MINNDLRDVFLGLVIERDVEFTLIELSRASELTAEQIMELVDQGLVEPRGDSPDLWRFAGASLAKLRCVQRLTNDLGVNLAGAVLAIELYEELDRMRKRLQQLR